mmetsp:Transcript_8444/g.35285  ORF Transcript_8444/g.35285 Transcript_8444/m.35285 type:complete len:392 (-) Transcript_8444:45-1220(-)|eukprot:CAMPEP_0114626010 /NCGR_PEP_ID=MMETSP0168-20121206/11560_1 /TAXON_ID=95228 ORGANISM="Vannella sp., Strain DIVA3 517/6/12" /NCGR_SAMPLE_ID=MMETSP0168 /ASSEMBLY_ACC=CAM_ASM_000044 /LENGTH=391 /DNA_ID=CAMNT_0001837299 /DNA_START=285 /DNA_END=1460 /DNA_ORIENTATION=+
MSFGTMMVHTASAWEDQPCPVPADQWDDLATGYDHYGDSAVFGSDLRLSVDVCDSYETSELFSMSVLDDFSLPSLSCTTMLVETVPERPKKRCRDANDPPASQPNQKKAKTEETCSTPAPMEMSLSGLAEMDSLSVLPSPEAPSEPSSPSCPASSPTCVSPKALFSPVSEYHPHTDEFCFGDLGFEDVYVPRRRTTRAQSKLLQPKAAPTKKQRNKLARDIAGLSTDKLQEIVQLVYPVAQLGYNDVDVEFDIADVDDKLFHYLREFVDSCTKDQTESASTSLRHSSKRSKSPAQPSSPSLSTSTNQHMNSFTTNSNTTAHSSPKSGKTQRKRPRKGKKTKSPVPEPIAEGPGVIPRSLTRAEVVIFQSQEVLTLAQTEGAEEDEFVDIGE